MAVVMNNIMLKSTFSGMNVNTNKTVKKYVCNNYKRRINTIMKATNSKDDNVSLNFSSWAPEVINSRCAMIGVTSGVLNEFYTGNDFVQQFQHNFPVFVLVSLLVTLGTFKTGKPETDQSGVFTPEAELLNGRVAMLAIASKLLIDYTSTF